MTMHEFLCQTRNWYQLRIYCQFVKISQFNSPLVIMVVEMKEFQVHVYHGRFVVYKCISCNKCWKTEISQIVQDFGDKWRDGWFGKWNILFDLLIRMTIEGVEVRSTFFWVKEMMMKDMVGFICMIRHEGEVQWLMRDPLILDSVKNNIWVHDEALPQDASQWKLGLKPTYLRGGSR